MTGRSIRAAPATAMAAAPSFGAAACSDPGGVGGSTAKLAALLHRTDASRVVMDGEPVHGRRHRAPCELCPTVGVVFQQPRMSADRGCRCAS